MLPRLLADVRAVLGRTAGIGGHRETDRLAATLAWYWAEGADRASPLAMFGETGAVSQATVDGLYDDLVALEQSDALGRGSGPRDGQWTTQAVVRALLDYAAVHRPRGPVADLRSLRDAHIAARVFRSLVVAVVDRRAEPG